VGSCVVFGSKFRKLPYDFLSSLSLRLRLPLYRTRNALQSRWYSSVASAICDVSSHLLFPDISLAAFGRKEIEIAEVHQPVLLASYVITKTRAN
jgi:hypothetical protein